MIPLAEHHGNPSKGHDGRCIFCRARAGAPLHHALAERAHWGGQRSRAMRAPGGTLPAEANDIMRPLLGRAGAKSQEAQQYLSFFTAGAPAAGHSKVQVPGEPERRLRAERQANGIPLPETVWHSILDTARDVGLSDEMINNMTVSHSL